MSDDIPFEIQMEIIKRISDIKPVIRCKLVSKAWMSTIDSKDFVTAHTLRHYQAHHHHHHHHLLIRKVDWSDRQAKYVSIVDDGTFPHQKLSVFVPDSANEFIGNDSIILGASHGLFCLYERETNTAVIWNPSIRKAVAIAVPNVSSIRYRSTIVGFGISRGILDPTLVKITYVSRWGALGFENTSTQVEVFTLKGGTWRSPLSSNNVPHKSIGFGSSQAVIDGVIYWDAVDRIHNVDDGYFTKHKLIISFDLTSEEFTKVNLPDRLELDPHTYISISILRESLSVLEYNIYDRRSEVCHVWLMSGHGCTRSFNKLYSIIAPPDDVSIRAILGFRKNGAPIVELKDNAYYHYSAPHAFAIYELESKSITRIGIQGLDDAFFVHSYMETLLLLGH